MTSHEKASTKVGVAVLSGLILAGLIYFFRTWVPPFLKWIWGVIGTGWVWAVSNHAVPGWVLLPLSLAAAWCSVRIVVMMRKPSVPPPEPEPHWRDFTEFEWEGILWRWQYDREGRLYGLASFCPQLGCDMQTYPRTGGYYGPGNETTLFTCDRCGHSPEVRGNKDQIEDRVVREIERLLRGDGWRTNLRAANSAIA